MANSSLYDAVLSCLTFYLHLCKCLKLCVRQSRDLIVCVFETLSRDLHRRFVKLTALVKGYLTRRLYKTEKVQSIIKSIAVSIRTSVHQRQYSQHLYMNV